MIGCTVQHQESARLSGLCANSPDVYIIPEWGRRGVAKAQKDFGFGPLAFEEGGGSELS